MTSTTGSTHNFQVNLAGIIDILANHLYSEEKVFLRELLQNATDALTARQQQVGEFAAAVHVELIEGSQDAPPQIVFEDNGIGLTEEEIHQFLSSIGASSKKAVAELTSREDFIGQFGIGLLSCFMVTDEIVLVTRSARGGPALEWRGNSDGSYRIRELRAELEPGTKVYLRQKEGAEKFYDAEVLTSLVAYYGGLLPFPIYYGNRTGEALNAGTAPFLDDTASGRELYAYGEQTFGTSFFDTIPLRTADGSTRGVAFVLPHEKPLSGSVHHRVYLKRMLISDEATNILPEWAFFVRAVINTTNLRPTASRESFYEDEHLERTRQQLGDSIKAYLTDLARQHPGRLRQLVAIHFNSLKNLALHDDAFFDVIIDYLPFRTTRGEMSLPEAARATDELLHVSDIDEYRQVAGVANAQRTLVLNTGYIYTKELLRRFGLRRNVAVREVNTGHFIQRFDDLTLREREAAFDFLEAANAALSRFGCRAVLRKFSPDNVPTIYYMDEETNFQRSIDKSREVADTNWAGVLGSISSPGPVVAASQLCLNFRHPLVRRLIDRGGAVGLEVEILYVQALLLGHHPLNNEELNILSDGLLQLMDRN